MILAYSLLLQLLAGTPAEEAFDDQVIEYASVKTGAEVTRKVLLNDFYEYAMAYAEKQYPADPMDYEDRNEQMVKAIAGLKPYVGRLIEEATVTPGDTCFLIFTDGVFPYDTGTYLTLVSDSTTYTASKGVPGVTVRSIPGINNHLLRRWDNYMEDVYKAQLPKLHEDYNTRIVTRAVIKGDSIFFDLKGLLAIHWVSAEDEKAFREEYGVERLNMAEAHQRRYEAKLAAKRKKLLDGPNTTDEQTDETAAVVEPGNSDREQPSLFRRIIDWIVGFFKRLFS